MKTLPVAVGVLVASACASAGGLYHRADCVSTLPADSLSLEEAVDSVALSRDVAGSWIPVSGRVVASIVYDSLGGLDTARVWSASLPGVARTRMSEALLAHARGAGTASGRVDLFVGDEKGPALRRVARLKMCAPRMLYRDRLSQQLRAEARTLGITYRTRVDVFVFVGVDGRATEVRINRASGRPDVDEAALRILRDAMFLPGMVEGIPVAVWASFPVTFTPAE